MDLKENIRQLLQETGPGHMTNTAYDTAWIARLGDLDKSMSDAALDWICENQLPDGSWGTSKPQYFHDRLICTLSAMIALARRGKRARDQRQLQRGLAALENLTNGATKGLMADPNGATVGFEMITPTLLAESESLGIISNQGKHILGRISRQREHKISLLKGRMISRNVTMAFSAEMAGLDAMRLLDIEDLQEVNGSVANSPSATAYYVTHIAQNDLVAMDYLHRVVVNGATPFASPFDVFERSWVLWNLSLLSPLDSDLVAHCQQHVDFLSEAWQPDRGVGFAATYTPVDGDDTSITYETLNRFGRKVNVSPLFNFEHENCFRCYDFETHHSISVNVHMLGALRQAGFDLKHPSIQKIIGFLHRTQLSSAYWIDKWHISPYYTTAHAIIACAGYYDAMVEKSVDWIVRTQNEDGSWGHYYDGMSTCEETAYCVQALAIWRQFGHHVSTEVVQRGKHYLANHIEDEHPPLWIGKCLYCPKIVVRAAVLSALQLVS